MQGDKQISRIRLLRYIAVGLVVVGVCLTLVAFVAGVLQHQSARQPEFILTVATLVAALIAGLVQFYTNEARERRANERVEKVETAALQNPDKPQLAWDLARTKLENYLDRNLGQLQSIFWLTLLVMAMGFAVVLFGLYRAYDAPATFPLAIVSSASGVIMSFVGGSFLLIYRSVLAQTRGYVSVLERINAVGMAVQVLGTIADERRGLRDESTAMLAKQLIDLYSNRSDNATPPSPP
jgi:hypothetical protein